jgi:hypothetical protein
MADENTILVVDDDRQKFEIYWQIFNDDPHEFDPLPPSENAVRHHPVVLHYLQDFSKFEEMFGQMIASGKRHPLCIVDMRLQQENDNRRGFETVRLVRELDPDISIVVATALPDVELDTLREVAGENTFLFHLPMTDEAQRAEFRDTVHRLVDRWNAQQRMLLSTRDRDAEAVPLSELLNELCGEWRRQNVGIEPYINPGLRVRSHRKPLTQGLHCVLRHAVEMSPPDSCIRVFGEDTRSGAMVTVTDERREKVPRSLSDLLHDGEHALGFFLFEAFLRLTGGSLKVANTAASGGTTITADIRHV